LKRVIYGFLIIFFLLNHIYLAKAQDYRTYSRRPITKYFEIHSGELDLKSLNFTYKEPEIGVKDKGKMYGFGAAYTYHHDLMFRAELDYYAGKIDYESGSGRLNDVPHYIVELRWLIGRDYPRYNSPICDYLTSYTGLGYRYWKDGSGGKVTDLGKYGYDRETTYLYSPLGLETIKRVKNQWFIGAVIEYDLFWVGKNKSHLSHIDPSAPDLEFNQDSGDGFRFALKMNKAFDRAKIGIVSFFHYWDIDQSETIILFDPSSGYWFFYEPENKTTEFGINLMVQF